MKKSLVSVLMTIYNHESFLKKSLNSIITQNYKNLELIAIDTGSSDKSKKILERVKDKRIKKKLPIITSVNSVKWQLLDLVFLSLPNGEAQKLVKRKFSYFKNLRFTN